MGMAAGQARLLSITARLSDNELRAQLINNDKMRLASESSQVSEAYITALNNAQLMFTNYDANNNQTYQQLTFNALTAFNPYNNQYALSNASGNILLSETDAANYEKAKASINPLETFLGCYGLEQSSSYFETTLGAYLTDNGTVYFPGQKTYTGADGNEYYANFDTGLTTAQLKAMYYGTDGYTGYENTLQSEEYWNYITAMQTYVEAYNTFSPMIVQNIRDWLDQDGMQFNYYRNLLGQFPGQNFDDDEYAINSIEEIIFSTGLNHVSLIERLTTISDADYTTSYGKEKIRTYINQFKTVFVPDTGKNLITSITKNTSTDGEGNTIHNYVLGKINNEYPNGYIFGKDESGNVTIFTHNSGLNPRMKEVGTITKNTDGLYELTMTTSSGTAVIRGATDADNNYVFRFIQTVDENNNITQIDAVNSNFPYNTNNYERIVINQKLMTDLFNNTNQTECAPLKDESGTTLVSGNYAYFTTSNSDYKFISENVSVDNVAKKVSDIIEEIYFNADKIFNTESETFDSANSANAKENAEKSLIALYNMIYGKNYTNYQTLKNENPEVTLQYLYDNDIIEDLFLEYGNDNAKNNDKIDGMINSYTLNVPENFKDIYEALLLDRIMDVYGEPKVAWVCVNDTNENGDAKAKWYENLFNRIENGGYKTIKNGLASSPEWIEFAFESGIVTLEQVDDKYTWNKMIYSNCSDITQQTNDAAIAKAEAEYKAAMNKIENKDKRYDMQLKNIDTEHNSLQVEYDSIKGAIDKNIERSFKMYS